MLNYTNYDIYPLFLSMGKVQNLGHDGNMMCAIYLTIVGVFSVAGNGVVLLVLLRSRKLRLKPHNLLLFNMATADILVSVAGYPFTTVSAYYGRYMFGNLFVADLDQSAEGRLNP
nr:hypothetical protein BaRGS_021420 [Batillaria attramentaria]